MMSEKFVTILVGPTCSGKSTIESALEKLGVSRVISVTTRTPRQGEVDGNQYHFIRECEFKEMQKDGTMVESVKFNGNHYGVTATALVDAVKRSDNAVVVCDPEGAEQIYEFCRHIGFGVLMVFVYASISVTTERLFKRYKKDLIVARESGFVSQLKVTFNYARRFFSMLTVEQVWHSQALIDPRCTLILKNNRSGRGVIPLVEEILCVKEQLRRFTF
jgi:guanylate kinase